MIGSEVRSALNDMLALMDMLSTTGLNQAQGATAGVLQERARGLLGLAEDVLDFTRVDTDALQLRQQDTAIYSVLEDVAEQFATAARERNTELVLDISPLVPRHINGDERRLRQILVYLVDNAVKFTSDGVVVLSVRPVARTDTTCTLRYEVRDTGIGIPKNQHQLAFEPFIQLSSTVPEEPDSPAEIADTKQQGAGLGLALCERLAALMGARVQLDSTPGIGSVFSVEVEHGVFADTTGEQMFLPGKNAVLICGCAPSTYAISSALKSWGMAVVVLEDVPPPDWAPPFVADVVIVDADLACGDADLAVHALRAHPKLEDVAAVVLAAREQPLAADARTVRKPVRLAPLYDVVSAATTPTGAPTSAMAISVNDAAPTERRKRILVAEDDIDNRHILRRILERAGYVVHEARDGQTALEMLAVAPYDALVLDLSMPRVDGFGVIKRTRERQRETGTCIPIIVVTADALAERKQRVFAAGADCFLEKPINAKALERSLAHAVGGVRRVLVVDDSAEIRALVKRHLEGAAINVEVVEAKDGAGGLAALDDTIALVIVDNHLPDMAGAELLLKLRAKRADVVVMALTADPDAEAALRAAGCTHFTLKPVARADLVRAVTRTLSLPATPIDSRALDAPTWSERVKITIDPDLKDLVPNYLANRLRDINVIRELLGARNFGAVARLGHDMKGSGGAYGLEHVSACGGRIELHGKQGDSVSITEAVLDLESFLRRVELS